LAAYTPFAPFNERTVLTVFGLFLVWLRVFSVVAQAETIVVTGLMANCARRLAGLSFYKP
jgi:hypothetical protein